MLCPLIICDLLGKLDIDARQIDGPGGQLSMPQAVRTAVSLCIASLYPKEHSEKLRLGPVVCFFLFKWLARIYSGQKLIRIQTIQ
jgi:hypothetical protein